MKKYKALIGLSLIVSLVIFAGCKTETVKEGTVVSADGVEISYKQMGKGEITVMFVPGWTNPKGIWDDQMNFFSQNYLTVSIDLPGTGKSGNNRTSWTIQNFAKDVSAVVNTLELKKVVLVGFSMGAGVVTEAASLLEDKVLGIVLVDDMKNIDMEYPPQMIAVMDSVVMDLVTNMTNEKLTATGFYKKNHEATFARIDSLYEGASHDGWRESFHGYYDWLNNHCAQTLQDLTVPLVAINSDRDPTNSDAIKKYIPDFQLNVIENTGHLLFWDEPDEFNRLLTESIEMFRDN